MSEKIEKAKIGGEVIVRVVRDGKIIVHKRIKDGKREENIKGGKI